MSVPTYNPAGTYRYGGLSVDKDEGAEVGSIFGIAGRWWNDLNGTTANNTYNSYEAQAARDFNSAEAAKNRQWEEYMSNTALQRQVADAKAAGLNPAALGGLGNGASTPSASPASAQAAHASPSSGAGLGSIVRGVLSAILFKKFSHTALAASSAPEAVKDVAREAQNTAKAVQSSNAYKYIGKGKDRMTVDEFRRAWREVMM